MSLALRLAALTLVYSLALASFAPADLLTGVAVSAAVLVAIRGVRGTGDAPAGELARRLVSVPVLLWAVTTQVVAGAWEMSLIVLGVRPLRQPGLVEIPLGEERSEAGLAFAAVATTLAPGDVVLDVDPQRRVMLLHTIDAGDPDAVRARFARQRERYGQRVFP